MSTKINFVNQIKQEKNEESIKDLVSKFVIKQLVDKMLLQYDKKDILDMEVPEFPI